MDCTTMMTNIFSKCRKITTIQLLCVSIFVFILTSITYSTVSLNRGYSNGGDKTNWVLVGGIGSDQVSFRIRLVPPMLPSFVFSLYKATPNSNLINILDINFSKVQGGSTSSSAMYTFDIDTNVTASSSDSNSMTNSSNATETQLEDILINTMWINPSTDETIWSIQIKGLEPETVYHYNVVDDTKEELLLQGKYHTPAPVGTRFNFSILTAGCSHTGSNHPIFYHLNDEDNVQMMIHLGDFHYGDVSVNDMQVRLQKVSTSLSAPYQNAFYSSTPLVSIWDDHDWLGNDSGNNTNGDNSVERGAYETALQSYQIAFPHYPLEQLSNGNDSNSGSNSRRQNLTTVPIIQPVSPYHAFTVGTVRFIVTDLRSESSPESMMSTKQYKWLRDELSNAPKYDYVVWISSKPWIGEEKPGKESWFGHVAERAELSMYISETIGGLNNNSTDNTNVVAPRNLMVISADAHMVAFDDGRNTYYGNSTEQSYSFPILQTGPLDRIGSLKGGPVFTHGCYGYTSERTNQYSRVSFEFPQSNISNTSSSSSTSDTTEDLPCINIESYRVHSVNSKEVIFQHRMCGQIFQLSSPENVGFCEMKQFQTVSKALISLSMLFTVVAMLLPCIYPCYKNYLEKKKAESNEIVPVQRQSPICSNNEDRYNNSPTDVADTMVGDKRSCTRYEDVFIAMLVFFGFALTLTLGIGIPFMKDIPIFTLRPYALILFIQSLVIVIILGKYYNVKRKNLNKIIIR